MNLVTVIEVYGDELQFPFSISDETWDSKSPSEQKNYLESHTELTRSRINAYTEVVSDGNSSPS